MFSSFTHVTCKDKFNDLAIVTKLDSRGMDDTKDGWMNGCMYKWMDG